MGENDPRMFGSSPFHARNNPWELPDISANPGAPNGKTPFVPLCFTLCSRFYSFLENQIIYLLEEGEAKKKKFDWKCHFPCGVFISKPSLILCVWIWNEALKWKPVFHFETSAWAPFSIQRWGFIPMFKNIKIRFPRFILSTSIFHHLVSLIADSFLLLSPLLILFYAGKGTKLAKMW